MKNLVLGIETSCDETAAAIVDQDDFIGTRVAIQDRLKLSEHGDHVCLLVVERDDYAVFYCWI